MRRNRDIHEPIMVIGSDHKDSITSYKYRLYANSSASEISFITKANGMSFTDILHIICLQENQHMKHGKLIITEEENGAPEE